MQVFSVVMAGGGGTRFWPLSRQDMPKQLLNFSGNDIMINETIIRNRSIIPDENVYIITNSTQIDTLKKYILKSVSSENILSEPLSKSTAACICYAAIVINKRYGDSLMCVFPSDAYVERSSTYENTLINALKCAEQSDSLVTIGIKPTYPATGYGYIRYSNECSVNNAFNVVDFVEKPDIAIAKKFIDMGQYLWNSGIFVWRTSTILDNFRRYIPKLYNKLISMEDYIDTKNHNDMLEKVYADLPAISVDHAILERSDSVVVLPGEFSWSDIGSWDALGAIYHPDLRGNIIKAEHIGIDTQNTIVYGNKLIATIGIENMIIVSTDDATLICPKTRAQDVKRIVEDLKLAGKLEYI